MLSLATASRVLIHPGATDMRLGVWGLSSLCGGVADGELHAFCSADRRTVKLLMREGASTWLCQKRLAAGRFQWPDGAFVSKATILQLQWLVDGPDSLAAMSAAGRVGPSAGIR